MNLINEYAFRRTPVSRMEEIGYYSLDKLNNHIMGHIEYVNGMYMRALAERAKVEIPFRRRGRYPYYHIKDIKAWVSASGEWLARGCNK